ncbi:MAG: hypothetical protein OXD43_00855 [Bacteroidetes bacterium]|nr:hypothetical protein [Bacteroidota bacterium]
MDIFNSIVSILTLVIITVGVFVALRSWRGSTHKNIKDDGIWKGSVDADRANFKEFMREIREDIKEINGKIDKINDALRDIFSRLPAKIETTQSPLGLSDLGKDVSKDLDAVSWANKTADMVQDKVKGKEAYQIQRFSFEYADRDDHYTDEERNQIHRIAYDRGISEEQVRRVLGIELRDKLLSIKGESH